MVNGRFMVPLKYGSAEIAAGPCEITSRRQSQKFLSTTAGVTNYILRKAGTASDSWGPSNVQSERESGQEFTLIPMDARGYGETVGRPVRIADRWRDFQAAQQTKLHSGAGCDAERREFRQRLG
jgi:hypothetical protein